jgi:hypothetical protein
MEWRDKAGRNLTPRKGPCTKCGPIAFYMGITPLLLLAGGLLAAYIPGRKAARIDPVQAEIGEGRSDIPPRYASATWVDRWNRTGTNMG